MEKVLVLNEENDRKGEERVREKITTTTTTTTKNQQIPHLFCIHKILLTQPCNNGLSIFVCVCVCVAFDIIFIT